MMAGALAPFAREESVDQSVIAVQIANGTYVPVLSSDSKKRRKLVVTTARDDQTNVKIELFRGSDETMADAEYVGSLVIDNIAAAPQGSADISVLLDVDDNGNLNATAKDDSSGEYQSLSVGLEQIGSEGGYDIPDFQITDEELSLEEISMDDEPLDLADDDFGADDLDLSLDAADDVSTATENVEPQAAEVTESGIGEEPAIDDALSLDEFSETASDDSLDGLDDLSLDEISIEDETSSTEELSATPDEMSLDEISLDNETSSTEELSTTADEFSLDESDEMVLDDLSFEDDEPVPAAADDTSPDSEDSSLESFDSISLDEDSAAPEMASLEGDANDFDISMDDLSFEAEPTEDDSSDVASVEDDSLEGLDSFSDAEVGFDDSLAEEAETSDGMVEADLGDEDFTFDEAADDTPIFTAPDEPESEDAPEDESAEMYTDDSMSPEEFDRLDSTPENEMADGGELEPRKSNGLIFAGYLVLALAALGVLTYLIFRLLEGPPAPPLRAFGGLRYVGVALLGVPVRSRRKRR